MQKRLTINKDFKPCPADDGEEVYANGIFKFNISQMIAHIQNNPDVFPTEIVVVKDIYSKSSHINEEHLDSVDVSKPVILAEIAPDRYNLIDGNHRAEKAVRHELEELKAYRLSASQHIQFLTHKESYEKYIDYWNDKLKEQVGTFAKDTLYHIRIVLMGFEPYIWRMIQVKPEMPLAFFHRLIQNVMGWQDLHLHHFIKGDTFYAPTLDDGGMSSMKQVDYKDLTIKDILTKQHEHVIYEYDFGDGWQHEIILEKIVPAGKKEHPLCLKGSMKCPPEDCGGVWGYMDMIEELGKLDGAERKLYLKDRFLDDDFNPDHFDKDEVNQQLKEWKAVWLNKWE
jgi:hypothetical protein